MFFKSDISLIVFSSEYICSFTKILFTFPSLESLAYTVSFLVLAITVVEPRVKTPIANTAKLFLTLFFIFTSFPKPLVVLQIILSKIRRSVGITNITTTILISAPLPIKLHIEEIISSLEYIPTPNVAANKQSPLTIIEDTELSREYFILSFGSFPSLRFSRYFVVIRIA